MEYLAFASIAYLAVRLFVAFTNLITRPYLHRGKPACLPFVSILIPARNEEGNIGALLSDLSLLNYPHFEIIVYDDDSDDNTALIIHEAESSNNRIRYLRGNGPDQGWLGKNYACDKLASQAKGEYFLYLDADVRVSSEILNDSIAHMQRHKLSLFSMFPVQIMKTWGEWMAVPLMNRILIGNLPMIMAVKSSISAFAAANGQFMMFDADVYRKNRFHYKFRDERVEDIRIARHMKGLGYRIHTLLSGGQISCRMYRNYREGLAGFSKNIHAFFGNSWLILILYNLLTGLGPFAVLFALSFKSMMVYLFLLILLNIMISVQSRQTVHKNLILMPFQQFSVLLISLKGVHRQLTGRQFWKGRKV